jgi:hypothetical protein
MKQAQIKALYPNIKDGYEGRLGPDGKIDPTAYHILEIPSHSIDGCEFQVSLMYFNPPFDSLTVIRFHFAGVDFSGCRDKTVADLMKRFGPHPRESDGGTIKYKQWFGPVNNVTFDELNSPTHSFDFSLSHSGAPGTYLE